MAGAVPSEYCPDRCRFTMEAPGLLRSVIAQAWLALRLALADQLDGEEPLPLVLDDPFGDWDASRVKQAASLLASVGQRRQIILLTGQSTVADQFEAQVKACILRLPAAPCAPGSAAEAAATGMPGATSTPSAPVSTLPKPRRKGEPRKGPRPAVPARTDAPRSETPPAAPPQIDAPPTISPPSTQPSTSGPGAMTTTMAPPTLAPPIVRVADHRAGDHGTPDAGAADPGTADRCAADPGASDAGAADCGAADTCVAEPCAKAPCAAGRGAPDARRRARNFRL